MGDKSEGGHVILISYGRNNLLFIVFYGNASDYLRPFAWLMSIYIHRLESPTFYTDNDEVSRCQGRLCVCLLTLYCLTQTLSDTNCFAFEKQSPD